MWYSYHLNPSIEPIYYYKYIIFIVEIFSPYKYRSVELHARWQCTRRIYNFSLIYKALIKQASYNFKMGYPC